MIGLLGGWVGAQSKLGGLSPRISFMYIFIISIFKEKYMVGEKNIQYGQ